MWVLLGILAFLVLLFSLSLTVSVSIREQVSLSVGIAGFHYPILPLPAEKEPDKAGKAKRKKKPKKKKRKHHKKTQAAEKAEKISPKPTEKSFGETVDFVITLMKSVVPGAVRLLSHLRFTGVRIYMTVAGDEADEVALRYGAVSAGIYNLLAVLDKAFTLRLQSVDIVPDFVSGEAVYDISFQGKLRLCHILFGGIGMIFKLAVNTIRHQNPPKEEAKRQNAASIEKNVKK